MITQEVRMEFDRTGMARVQLFPNRLRLMGLDRRTVKKPLQGRQPPVYRSSPTVLHARRVSAPCMPSIWCWTTVG